MSAERKKSESNGKLPKLLTPEQVIEILQLDADGCTAEAARERLRNRCRARQIPYVKFGRLVRFRPEDIEQLIEKNTVPAIQLP